MRYCLLATLFSVTASAALGQAARDAGSVARDLAATAAPQPSAQLREVQGLPEARAVQQGESAGGLTIGAIKVDGVPSLPREAFAPAYADYLGKQATTQDLQSLAKAVASVARARGYVFATATIPRQTIEAGMITVQIDEGDIAAVRVIGSRSARLQRTLDLIVGHGVRRDVLERQLLLAGDIPGIEVLTTKLVHEDIGNVLIVEVRESRGDGFLGVDNFGASDLGPVRARLRYDFVDLAGDGDVLSVQAVVTPADPRQLAYLSARYAASIGTAGTQVAVTGALGRAEPAGSGLQSNSTYLAVSASTPLVRANAASVWANAEVGVLRVDGTANGVPDRYDNMAVATGWLYATTRTGRGRLSGALGLSRGLGLAGTTERGDPRASRADAGGVFTKGYFWADWTQPVGHGFSVKLAASGQLADRPLLAAQEIGLGGASYGRAYDFSERFGDSGFMGSGEVRWRWSQPVGWIDWIEPYAFADAGRTWNLQGGFGEGDLSSAGGGARAALGKLQLSAEVAVPLASARASSGDKRPRINVSVGRRF
jgi:hemolysin activation/secretion protein